jgi:hypothetical protein
MRLAFGVLASGLLIKTGDLCLFFQGIYMVDRIMKGFGRVSLCSARSHDDSRRPSLLCAVFVCLSK